jgi:hypothetical protein
MGRYVSIFLVTLLVAAGLFLAIPLLFGDAFSEISEILSTILVLLLAFTITQLFYIIDLLKKKSR